MVNYQPVESYVVRVRELENSLTVPHISELPHTPWSVGGTLGDRYLPAFAVQGDEDAAIHLLLCVSYQMRNSGERRANWRDAIQRVRDDLWWFALARDVTAGRRTLPDGTSEETTTSRDFVKQFYQAETPQCLQSKLENEQTPEQKRQELRQQAQANRQRDERTARAIRKPQIARRPQPQPQAARLF